MIDAHVPSGRTIATDHQRHIAAFIDDVHEAMIELRDARLAGAVGIGVNETEVCEESLDWIGLDEILLAGRNAPVDRGAMRSPDRCVERGVQAIVGRPHNGCVTELDPDRAAVQPPPHDYATPDADVVTRTHAPASIRASAVMPLPAAAAQFPLRNPAVARVVTGLVGAGQDAEKVARIATDASGAGSTQDADEEQDVARP